jgi:hypothetical protein
MNSLRTSYSYKFLDDKQPVNIICKNTKHQTKFGNTAGYHILSEPYQSKERPCKRNAIVGFTNDLLTARRFEYEKRMHALNKVPSDDLQIVQISIYNLREYCKILNMPMIVYINAYCTTDINDRQHHFEVYFRYDQEEQYIKELMRLSISQL